MVANPSVPFESNLKAIIHVPNTELTASAAAKFKDHSPCVGE
jgi:hypothetical protein